MEILIVYRVAFHWIWIKLLEYIYKHLESIDIATKRFGCLKIKFIECWKTMLMNKEAFIWMTL